MFPFPGRNAIDLSFYCFPAPTHPPNNQQSTKKQKQNNYQTYKKQGKENLTYCQQKISIEPDEEMTYG